jgi:hypothetical protein
VSIDKERLKEIREEMFVLLDEAAAILKGGQNCHWGCCIMFTRAQAYWLSHIACALGHENYPTVAVTFRDTLEEIETLEEEERHGGLDHLDPTPTGY